MINILRLLALAAVVLLGSVAGLSAAQPMHNFNNPEDVDANGYVDTTDLYLVVDELRMLRGLAPIMPLVATESQDLLYLDTSNDSRLNGADAMYVVNYLLMHPTSVPEPGSVISAGAALVALAGYCWQKRRRASK